MTNKAAELTLVDPNAPSVLSQSITTSTAVAYQLSFYAFCSNPGLAQQNLTVSFGTGSWSVQPPGSWETYTFAASGLGANDALKFAGVDTAGGTITVYTPVLVSLG